MKVIMCSYGVGYKSTLPPKNVIKLNLNTYRTEYRERTEEELQIKKEEIISSKKSMNSKKKDYLIPFS